MVLSKDVETASKTAFQKISASLRTTLLNSTVKLTGTGVGGTFTGSGVIVGRDGTSAWILSAKHNLYIRAGETEPPEWSTALIDSFKANIKIFYDGPMDFGKTPAREAAITDIVPVTIKDGEQWEYDVMIVKSTDADLRGFAYVNGIGFPLATELAFLKDPKKYLEKKTSDKIKQIFFVQLGYGNVREIVKQGTKTKTLPTAEVKGTAADGQLQYRMTAPLAKDVVTTYNEITGGYAASNETIQLTADPDNSTAPGDSGGPLFVAYQTSTNAWEGYLIGVTTGADMSTAREVCPPAGKLRVNNISTSLQYCYKSGTIPPQEGA